MDRTKRIYDRKKATLNTAINAMRAELGKADKTVSSVQTKLQTLRYRNEDFMDVGKQYLDLLDEDGTQTADLYTMEDELADTYGRVAALIMDSEAELSDMTQPAVPVSAQGPTPVPVMNVNVPTQSEHLHRLPKLELPKFGGESREWLQFWNSFKTIHEDDKMQSSLKFQYLLAHMKKGSDAEAMVLPFQNLPDSYDKAVDGLEKRYGRSDMLIEIYVRDLLSLVLDNKQNNNGEQLSSLYHKLQVQLNALSSLGVTKDKCAVILYPMVESSLPTNVMRSWEQYRQQQTVADLTSEGLLNKLLDYLKMEVESQERIRLARQPLTNGHPRQHKQEKEKQSTISNFLTTQLKMKCIFCGGNHASVKCFKAMDMTMENRKKFVAESKACFNCLKVGHFSKDCKEKPKCPCCGRRHLALFCTGEIGEAVPSQQISTVAVMKKVQSETILQTVLFRVHGKKKSKIVRGFFDSGASSSYVLKETAEELGLKITGRRDVVHALFGGVTTKTKRHNCYRLLLSSLNGEYSCQLEVQDSDCICDNIPGIPCGAWLQELKQKGIILTEDSSTSTKVEVMFGNDVFGKLLTGKLRNLNSGPTAIHTVFGWTVGGRLLIDEDRVDSTTKVFDCHVRDVAIQDLWNLDVIGITDPVKEKTKDELAEAAVEHFKKTVKRNTDGRYVVNLPWIEGHPPLPSYRFLAEKKLVSTTNVLKKNNVLPAYNTMFRSWEEDGIIEKISSSSGHYLSHHGVLKLESETTPVRPVFNASFKTKGHPSLNDCLVIGPNLLEDIVAILLRMRIGKVAVTSDIRKAFLQIEIAEEDRDFVRFLWYKDDNFTEVQEYRHRRVVFGVSSSPFLLNVTINHHLSQYSGELKPVADMLLKSFYVDNSVLSMDTFEEALDFKEKATHIMAEAQMDLRCWEIGPTNENKVVPVLGLSWSFNGDSLSCDTRKLMKLQFGDSVTRRELLSISHTVFDPLGFTCPFTIVPKILLQQSYKMDSGWDKPLPDNIRKEFLNWSKGLDMLVEYKIPRCITNGNPQHTWTLNVFCDASAAAYATCIYLRSGLPGDVTTQLVSARSRVSPMKNTTIPRLELLAALCGARLCAKVKQILEFPEIPVLYFSDSTTVITWIQQEENWSVFVNNRVQEIRRLSLAENWYHVPGKENPADIASRGASVDKLIEIRWWEGPVWLKEEADLWPLSDPVVNEEEVSCKKKKTVTSCVAVEQNDLFAALNKHSDYHTILRVTAYVLRFVHNMKKKTRNTRETEPTVVPGVDFEELQNAETTIVKMLQFRHFASEKDKRLESLAVFQDSKGLLRVRTRRFAGEEERESSCPLVLPNKDPVVYKLIWKVHKLSCHAGTQIMLPILREKFWVLHARRFVWTVIRSCARCQRFKSRPLSAPQGPLPEDRVLLGSPFNVTGVDLAGPLFTKGNKKVWIVLFTCASYRAIHLEMTTHLTTESFIQAYRRFIARRGRPEKIYSDNGTNFIGTRNLLNALDWKEITETAAIDNIKWKLNLPTASWWGGFWERLIGIVKQLLRSVLGSARVTNEELNTLLCDVESVVNNRPLTYVNDRDELAPLTPNMFISCGGNPVTVDVDTIEREHLTTRFRNMQHCRDEMRNRFQKEYLALLVHVGKQKKEMKIEVGDVVLIGSDNKHRLNWPMGLVIETLPGKDGVTRTVKLKTATGVLLRPIQRLYPMEISSNKD